MTDGGRVYLLHAPGRADFGVQTTGNTRQDDGQLRRRLDRLRQADGPEEVRRVLLQPAEQRNHEKWTAPLRSAVSVLETDEKLAGARFHLMTVSTSETRELAETLESALAKVPDLYGLSFVDVTAVSCGSLEEEAVAGATAEALREQGCGTGDRAVVPFGSGATQALFGILDAAHRVDVPWSMVSTAPGRAGQPSRYDPTVDLQTDPVVPLLRRWRYHDLLWRLVHDGEITVTTEQRELLHGEAQRWGDAYTHRTAEHLRALMAAAVMRRDGTSGFAVRAYVEAEYEERLARDGVAEGLLAVAQRRIRARDKRNRKPLLGQVLGEIRDHADEEIVRLTKQTSSGAWLASEAVCRLNDMGADAAHEMRAPKPDALDALRTHLAECGETEAGTDADEDADGLRRAGLAPEVTVPSRRAWYLTILGGRRSDTSKYAIEEIVDAEQRGETVDVPVRRYLAVDDGDHREPLPMGLLVLGTESGTATCAQQLVDRLATLDRPAYAGTIRDGGPSSQGSPANEWSAAEAKELIEERLAEAGDDVGALVVVPTGPKPHVLTLLSAAHRIAAERGVPLFLRQLVDRRQDVAAAGLHRLPLRFGTDRAMAHAARHACAIGEWDTAARLLGAMTGGEDLAARVGAFAQAMRCALPVDSWPAEIRGERTIQASTVGLAGQRIEAWSRLPGLAGDVPTQMRAIVGACAAFESSRRGAAKSRWRPEPLFKVRNKLPITHGDPLTKRTIQDLVACHTEYHDVPALFDAMVEKAEKTCGAPDDRKEDAIPRLSDLLTELYDEVSRLAQVP